MKNSKRLLFVAALMACSVGVCAYAADAPSFPFTIPWDDAQSGTATDVSFLNTLPAGTHGRIVVRGEQFVEEQTGKSIRFFGTNFCGKANFPTRDEAEKVARHAAKYGINLVRIHHLDNDWDIPNGTSFWSANNPQRKDIDPDQLDKLDYLIYQLKQQGIYVNLNLKVSKTLGEADGFPPSVSKIPFSFQKRVDEYNQRMIELQKDYARQLLTHVNPYTKMKYSEDPAVVIVEINNENSLVGEGWMAPGTGLAKLPEPFRGELAALWNKWLASKYSSDDKKLEAAWKMSQGAAAPVIKPDTQWWLNCMGSAKATLTIPGQNAVLSASPRVSVTGVDGTDWHVQLVAPKIEIQNGQSYTLRFSAKASKDRTIHILTMGDRDYKTNGLVEQVKIGTEWQDYTYDFIARDVDLGHTSLLFNMGEAVSDVNLRNVQIQSAAAGLQPGQSLTKGNLPFPESMNTEQRRDWVQFLTETEHDYALGMRQFLRNELGVRANIICSQIYYGGLTGYSREAEMDFADDHTYWQHPEFPGGGWDELNWTIKNTPLVDTWAKGQAATLDASARLRWAGRPFTISEYDHPAPSDFVSEMMPIYSTFAAVQDWSAIYTFDYGMYGHTVPNDHVLAFFEHSMHPAKFAFYPNAAVIFRTGLFPAATTQRVVQMPARPYERWASLDAVTKAAGGSLEPSAVLNTRWGVKPDDGITEPKLVTSGESNAAGQAIRLESMTKGPVYIAQSPKAIALAGFVGGQKIQTSDLTISFDEFRGNFAGVMMTAMDNQAISQSGRILLTVVGRAENQEMGWNATRTSIAHSWGHGPVLVDGISARVELGARSSLKIYALDSTGKRISEVPAQSSGGKLQFAINPSYATVWYELAVK